MLWKGRRQSQNIEDRRGMGPAGGMRFPAGLRLPRGAGGGLGRGVRRGGIGGIGLILVVLVALFFGVDPSVLLQGGPGGVAPPAESPQESRGPGDDQLRDFVAVVLADTEETWNQLFHQLNRTYQEPKLVLFSGAVQSACGFAQAAMGPFYCPGDRKVYIDLSFYRDLKQRFRAPGDFAQAYVIAHEIGHHVQTLLGISQQVEKARRGLSTADSNALSVRLELQADCFAGVWAHHAQKLRQILEAGDVEEGLNAASAIGDDRLQRQATGRVTPESFTHGSSAQRVRWFKQGLTAGSVQRCDTFGAN